MNPIKATQIKICCIASIEEARLAIRCGASALGFVSAMPSGPGTLPEDHIAEIVRTIPTGISSFLLTSKQDAASIIVQQQRTLVNTLQLVDAVSNVTYKELRKNLPNIKLVQVIHVMGKTSIDEAQAIAQYVDAVLLDSGNPRLVVKELGGTGRTHDWSISRTIREVLNIPCYLAGGLNPENVADAIARVGSFGLDVCGGVRTEGTLDEKKLEDFFRQARTA